MQKKLRHVIVLRLVLSQQTFIVVIETFNKKWLLARKHLAQQSMKVLRLQFHHMSVLGQSNTLKYKTE